MHRESKGNAVRLFPLPGSAKGKLVIALKDWNVLVPSSSCSSIDGQSICLPFICPIQREVSSSSRSRVSASLWWLQAVAARKEKRRREEKRDSSLIRMFARRWCEIRWRNCAIVSFRGRITGIATLQKWNLLFHSSLILPVLGGKILICYRESIVEVNGDYCCHSRPGFRI